ncbi:MAG TPA: tetratricopeptide repeat protein [Acidobacteriota bacterium]|nr:tetratricopeptide repeat protein [Acidobacteriota bacterium]
MKAYSLLLLLIISPHPLAAAADGLDQAIQLYQHGRFYQAADLLSRMVPSSGTDAELRLWFGKALLKTHKWDEAVHQMEKAVELKPNEAVYYLWLGRAFGGRASHSTFFTAPGWAKKVFKSFETAERLAPENLDVRFDLMSYYLNAPAFLGGGRDKALAEAEAIGKVSPSAGCTARSLIFEKEKVWDQARAELLKATTMSPRDVNALLDLADFLLRRREYPEAEAKARKALRFNASLPRAKLILAAAQIRLGEDLAEAESTLETLSQGPLTDDDPDFEDVFYWLGQAYLAEGKKQEAQGAFSAALRYNPDYDKAKSALSKLR